MRAVRRKAVRANTKRTKQAKDVLLVLPLILVDSTTNKESVGH